MSCKIVDEIKTAVKALPLVSNVVIKIVLRKETRVYCHLLAIKGYSRLKACL